MKKRIITLLAVVALLVTCAVFAVQATGDDTTTTTPTYIDLTAFKCPCSQCVAARAADPAYIYPVEDWIEYVEGANIRTTVDNGHYYYDESLSPGGNITIDAGKEVVFVLDNMTLNIGGTSRAMTIGGTTGSILHIVGNNATVQSRSTGTSATEGAFAQIYSGGELHLYGGVTIQKGTSTLPSASSGMFRMPTGSSLLHLHASTGMGLPSTAGNPIVYGADLNGTGTSNHGGVAKLANSAATVTIDAGTVYGAKAGRGGAFYNNGGTININGGTIYGGQAVNRGGIIHNNSGTVNITGNAELYAYTGTGTADYRGICVAGGTVNFKGGTIFSANEELGDGIALTGGTLRLAGNATVENTEGTLENNIWRWSTEAATAAGGTPAKIQIDNAWTGTASLYLPELELGNHGSAVLSSYLFYGSLSGDTFTNGTSTTAKKTGMYLEYEDHDNPQLAGFQAMLSTCRYVIMKDGKVDSWHVTPSTAITDYVKISNNSTKYIKAWGNYTSSTTNLNTKLYIDLNGHNLTKLNLGANGEIYAFDSTAKAGESGSTISVATQPITQFNGKTYVAKTVEGTTTVYPVDVKVTGVSLRPGTTEASMYYTATIKAHADAGIDAWGVAVTLDENETELTDHLYTRETEATEFNGVLVKGIAKNGAADNADRAAQPIYAKAYIEVDGKFAMSAAVNKTLKDVVDAVLALDQSGLTQAQIAAISAMQAASWFTSINA